MSGEARAPSSLPRSLGGELPFIDVHSLAVDAVPERAWDAVAQVVRGWAGGTLPRRSARAGALLAWMLRCSGGQMRA